MTDRGLVDRLAELAVVVGANVQAGQVVTVGANIGQGKLARAIAEQAYRRGARFVDVSYFDPYVKRARIELAAQDTLDGVPSWYRARVRALAETRSARISLAGPTEPEALRGLDPDRLGRDQLPWLNEWMEVIQSRTVNWTVVPCPTEDWARLCFPELPEPAAVERLRREIAHVCRLDEPDPATAWRARAAELGQVGARVSELRLDALHLQGPGTDLTIGLLPSSSWLSAKATTVDGLEHLPNVPTEEVFTSPDPERVDGHVRSTRPLVLADGTLVRGLEVRFERGRAVAIEADEGAAVLRGRAVQDEGAGRLGEVALVDRSSRVGRLETVFYETLLDENAASHLALGDGFREAVDEDDAARVNRSGIHVDFMVGCAELDVTGITRDGRRLPLLRDGAWQI
ncbi:MAG TPA: aminopeptidase [Gaiellaceae bacterium]|nr:aminopeptidase [Gaiellaceae bacterium]